MNGKEIFRELVTQSSVWSQNRVAREVGMTNQDLSQRMRLKSDLRTDVFAELVGVLGYDVVVVPKGSRLPNGSIKVESDE